jgi:hypothetical protein
MYSSSVRKNVPCFVKRQTAMPGDQPEIPARDDSMMHKTSPILRLVMALLVPACSGNSGGDASAALVCQGTSIVANEQNNYAFSSTLVFHPSPSPPKPN